MRLSFLWNAPIVVLVLTGCGPSTDATTVDSAPAVQAETGVDPIPALVGRLDLERYKATIKGLTQFGDRLHGTDRNRAAIDWIEAQLKTYGCATERFAYEYPPPEGRDPAPPPATPAVSDPPRAVGGGRPRGVRVPTVPSTDLNAQTDPGLRELNAQASVRGRARVGLLHEDRGEPAR